MGYSLTPKCAIPLAHRFHERSNFDYLFNAVAPVPVSLGLSGPQKYLGRNVQCPLGIQRSARHLLPEMLAKFLNLLVSKHNLQEDCKSGNKTNIRNVIKDFFNLLKYKVISVSPDFRTFYLKWG